MKFLSAVIAILLAFPSTPTSIDNVEAVRQVSLSTVHPTEQSLQAAESVVGIQTQTGLGSATYIGDGLYVSAHHVAEGAEDLPIAVIDFHLQTIHEGNLVAINRDYDLIIIKVEDIDSIVTPAAPVAWDDAKEGDIVHGVGFGVSYSDEIEGCERRIWSGTVAGFRKNIGGHQPNCVLSTNPAIPGDSGGALFNDKGELLGVIHATDYIHTYSIRNACIHQLLRRLEHAE